MKTLHQRLTNKALKQLIAANKEYPIIVKDIREVLKENKYVFSMPFKTGCDLCTYVFNSHISSSLVIDAFKPFSDD